MICLVSADPQSNYMDAGYGDPVIQENYMDMGASLNQPTDADENYLGLSGGAQPRVRPSLTGKEKKKKAAAAQDADPAMGDSYMDMGGAEDPNGMQETRLGEMFGFPVLKVYCYKHVVVTCAPVV
jgi:hypothetical protein